MIEKYVKMESIGMYRTPTQYEGVYKYECKEGYHFESFGTNYGRVIWGGKALENPYVIVKDKEGDGGPQEGGTED